MRHHLSLTLGVIGLVVILLAMYVLRKIFDRRRGLTLPLEDQIEISPEDAL